MNQTIKINKFNNRPSDKVDEAASARIGTRSKHYMQFLEGIMNILNFYSMKARYLVMDNVPIYSIADVKKLIESREYKPIFLLLYSPFFKSNRRTLV
ncbi:hypothetical protein BJ944DRAFT_164481 [Cunninghamella echinulata]|nr:hypothetical protein BJ944DRAFT_164481 [Cunninghamella echinulata]